MCSEGDNAHILPSSGKDTKLNTPAEEENEVNESEDIETVHMKNGDPASRLQAVLAQALVSEVVALENKMNSDIQYHENLHAKMLKLFHKRLEKEMLEKSIVERTPYFWY